MFYALFAGGGTFIGFVFGSLLMYANANKRLMEIEKKNQKEAGVKTGEIEPYSYNKGWEDATDYIKRGDILDAKLAR